jgi:hypothetical protein
VLLELVGVVLGSGQSKTRGNNTLDPATVSTNEPPETRMDIRRVVGKVKEESDALHAAILFEIAREETTGLHVNTHGGEHDGEVLLVAIMDILGRLLDQTGLSTDLSSNLIVRKTGGRENRDLLASGNGVHGVNGRDTRRDHFLRVNLSCSFISHEALAFTVPGAGTTYPRVGVDRLAVDIQIILRQHLGTLVNRATRTIENTTQHVLRDTQF